MAAFKKFILGRGRRKDDVHLLLVRQPAAQRLEGQLGGSGAHPGPVFINLYP
jgi:hypothetical protein